MGVQLSREESLKVLLDGGKTNGDQKLRTFWLEPTDLGEARTRLLPKLEKGVKLAKDALQHVLELLEAVSLPDAKERDRCLAGLLAQLGSAGTDRLSLSDAKAVL